MRLDLTLPAAEDLYPRPEVSGASISSWRDNPMTEAVLVEFYRERHRQVSDAFRGSEEAYWLRKGRVEMIDKMLGAIEQLEAEILNRKQRDEEPPEDEE